LFYFLKKLKINFFSYFSGHHEPGKYGFCPNYANEPEISCSNSCSSKYSKTFEEDKHFIEKSYVLSKNVEAI